MASILCGVLPGSYVLHKPCLVHKKARCVGPGLCDLPRIPNPRRWVNKGKGRAGVFSAPAVPLALWIIPVKHDPRGAPYSQIAITLRGGCSPQ